MSRQIKTLHLASFHGNIGDNANHGGFYTALNTLSEFQFEITELEIREFYRKQFYFDEQFVALVNQHDLLVIGGGNYFELWVEHSPTGTSIMIEPELFKQIKIPVIFNALGVDSGLGASLAARAKFKSFLDIVLDDKKNSVSIRNDGAKETITELIGPEYLDKIQWTPDAGCNVEVDDDFLCLNKSYIAVNLAGDMLDVRFPGETYDSFIEQLARLLTNLVECKKIEEIVLIPHIFKDLSCIQDLLQQLPDKISRAYVTVAPLMHGQGAERKIFSIYANAKLTLAMRFHANLCSIALETPTIPLVNYPQIEKLYHELGLTDRIVHVGKMGFETRLADKISCDIKNEGKEAIEEVATKMKQDYANYIIWLNRFLAGKFK